MSYLAVEIPNEEWVKLPGHVQRMVAEETELYNKLMKLEEFTNSEKFKELDEEDQVSLIEQSGAMAIYDIVLRRRIAKARKSQ